MPAPKIKAVIFTKLFRKPMKETSGTIEGEGISTLDKVKIAGENGKVWKGKVTTWTGNRVVWDAVVTIFKDEIKKDEDKKGKKAVRALETINVTVTNGSNEPSTPPTMSTTTPVVP